MEAGRKRGASVRLRAGLLAIATAACVAALPFVSMADSGQSSVPARAAAAAETAAPSAPAATAEAAAPADAAATAVVVAPWRVIVHPANTLRSIAHEELERIYRRRSRFWPDRTAILPLNLPGSDPLRRAFSDEILHCGEDELATFWNREYFQGVAPPAVLQSSGAVRAYVAATPGAIGYVSPEAVDSSVAVVEVTNGH